MTYWKTDSLPISADTREQIDWECQQDPDAYGGYNEREIEDEDESEDEDNE